MPPLDIDLADSITTWRLTASAVTADGRLGATECRLKVFQPFFVDLNLPVALTRGDEVAVPVVVYNYLDKPQTVDADAAPTATGSTPLGRRRRRRSSWSRGEVRASVVPHRASRRSASTTLPRHGPGPAT